MTGNIRTGRARLGALLLAGALCAGLAGPLHAGGNGETEPDWSRLLPAGAGKEYATALCGRCHTVGVLVLQRRSRGDWRDSLLGMNTARQTGGELCACIGGPISDEEIEILSSYLSEAFGPKNPIDQLPLNVNSASPAALARLPGMDAADAQKIVARRRTAPFQSPAEIQNLLGREKFRLISPFVDTKDSNFRSDGMLTM